ncbi:O-antigen polymerase [Pseudoroseicyclus tamaricis]|uniref:Oligosaccharide repeat unit polymerase n=1 Tax=Pseudoroseicyclus tamaricis TaxID=2705421 RepID=A0A6B2JY74_9RHOB|nr:O-antigen polymerase [Pseudoroseicyclus tamaricis]NDV01244.1 oligosaccharide repeat unit polymerase [Pseudoroseicyclus tamaricis]
MTIRAQTRAQSEDFSVLLALIGAAVQLATAILSVTLQTQDRVDTLINLLLLGTALFLLSSATSRQKAGIDFLISFFFLFFLAFPGYMQISLGIFPWGAQLPLGHLSLGIGLIALSQLSYAMGQTYAQSKPPPRVDDSRLTVLDVSFYVKWSWGLALFAIICAGLAGPDSLLTARQERGEGGFEGLTQQFLFISRAVSVLAMVMMIYLARFCPFAGLRRQCRIALVLYIPIFFVIHFPPALSRFALFGAMIAISCPFLNYKNRVFKVMMIVLSILFLLFVYPVAKILADGTFSVAEVVESVRSVNVLGSLVRADFDAFMQIVSTVEYLEEGHGGIRWGYNFFGVLLFFVPRGIWPGKPRDTGSLVSESLGYWYNNVSSPLPAESLMAFGLIGPVIVFALLGYFVLRIERAAGSPGSAGSSLSQFVLYAITMGFIVIIMRGALNAVAPAFASGFLAFALMMFVRRNNFVWTSS